MSLLKEFLDVAAARKGQGLRVTKSADKFYLLDAKRNELGECRLDFTTRPGNVTLWRLSIHNAYRQSAGLGRFFMKAIGSFAQEQNIPRIDVRMVQQDGLSFWPYMGAQPSAGFAGYAVTLMRVAKYRQTQTGEGKKLMHLFHLTDRDEREAWFRMTEKHDPLCLQRQTVRHIGQLLYHNDTLSIDLDNALVRRRLGIG